MTTTVLRAARHDDRPSGLDARRSVLRGWDFLLALGVPLLGASGCYADVLAGAQRPLGTTTPEFEAPAWNLGVAVGVMSDFANYTDGEVPFAMAFGWGPDEIAADTAPGATGAGTQYHEVGRWHGGLEVGLGHSNKRVPNLWWSASGALVRSDSLVETSSDDGSVSQEGFGWSAMTGPVLRLGFDDISLRFYFEAKLSRTSVDTGARTFMGGQMRVRLHDWRVLILGGLFEGLASAQAPRGSGGQRDDGNPDARSHDVNTRAIDQRNREQQRRVQCGGQSKDSSGARCP